MDTIQDAHAFFSMFRTQETFDGGIAYGYLVEFKNPIVYRRCLENHDDEGTPQPDVKGGEGWRNVFYPFKTKKEVIQHIAWVIGKRGWTLSQLDGFADLPDDAVSVRKVLK